MSVNNVLLAFPAAAALADVAAEASRCTGGGGVRITMLAVVKPLPCTAHASMHGTPWPPSRLEEEAIEEGTELCRRVAAATALDVSVEMRTVIGRPDRVLRTAMDRQRFDLVVVDPSWMSNWRFRRFAAAREAVRAGVRPARPYQEA